MSLPEKFVERMRAELGEEEGDRLLAALDTPAAVSIRLNPEKCGDEPFADARKVPWCASGRYLEERPAFTLDVRFHAGMYYVQEASSQFVDALTGDIAGCRVLDVCAAPGGKSTLYAAKVGREGLVVANEIDRRRAQVLADNVRKWGLGNVAVTSCDSKRLAEVTAWFDVVAVDAPCSGEGMFRKDMDAREEWSEANVALCARRQEEILRNAWQALKPGGRLIYSTCTFNREEDEGSLERFAAWAGEELEAVDAVSLPEGSGIVCGRQGVFQTFHFYPHRTEGEGFFAAVARKSAAVSQQEYRRDKRAKKAPFAELAKNERSEVERWVMHPGQMKFSLVADTVYAWYKPAAEWVRDLSEVLPVIYSGVAVGQIFKSKLKPDAALALFAELNRGAVPVAELDREEALSYLRKTEVAAGKMTEGLNLVTCGGAALGFAKRIGNRVNNLYPNSLRILKQQ